MLAGLTFMGSLLMMLVAVQQAAPGSVCILFSLPAIALARTGGVSVPELKDNSMMEPRFEWFIESKPSLQGLFMCWDWTGLAHAANSITIALPHVAMLSMHYLTLPHHTPII